MSSPRFWRGPGGLVAVVGGCVGLLFLLFAPPWGGGADEATHFARALDMANGRLTPAPVDGEVGSRIPAAFVADQQQIIDTLLVTSPWGNDLFSRLRESSPDWDDTVVIDTRPTTAASPVAYAPAAVAMTLPSSLGWSGVTTVWAGRLGDLAVYLGLALAAVRIATAFRWTIAITALLPMNLAVAASISPDSLTIGALLLVLAAWTRVWTGHAARDRRDAPELGPDVGPPARAAVDWTTVAWVGGSSLLLALSKAPYFLLLAAFPALLLIALRDRTVRVAAAAASAAAAVGVVFNVIGRADYEPATVAFGDPITYQPDVQIDRILGDPLGFAGTLVGEWVSSVPEILQRWTNQIGVWNSKLPAPVPLLIVLTLVAAAMLLDRDDLLRLRSVARWIWVVGWAGLVVAIYTSTYIYFDDTVDGVHIGEQAPRYLAPLFGVAIMGLAPRWALRGRGVERVPRPVAVGAVVAVEVVAAVAITIVWLWTGDVYDPL